MNSDFDPDVLLAELNSILDIDMSEFGFPTLEFPEESEQREKDGYFGDARENTYKSTNLDRYDESRTAGYYQNARSYNNAPQGFEMRKGRKF